MNKSKYCIYKYNGKIAERSSDTIKDLHIIMTSLEVCVITQHYDNLVFCIIPQKGHTTQKKTLKLS